MIPKIIHYVHIGHMSAERQSQIDAWRRKLPEWTFVAWNDKNVAVDQNDFATYALQQEKYAFVSDYIRLKVLEQYGGIYLDTDMVIERDFSEILDNHLVMGYLFNNVISTSFMAAEPHNPVIQKFLKLYDNSRMVAVIKSFEFSNNAMLTNLLLKEFPELRQDNSMQILEPGVVVFSKEYFSVGSLLPNKSFATHEFDNSWSKTYTGVKATIRRAMLRVLGRKIVNKILAKRGAERASYQLLRDRLAQ